MREPLFLKQNRQKWEEFQETLFDGQEDDTDPDRMADLYIQLTDDLAYSRTFYPRSKVVKYLNGLAAKTHLLIYQNKKEQKNRFLTFFGEDVPLTYHRLQPYFLYALLIFLVCTGMGWLSTIKDSEIPSLFLGREYVEMTISNIESGDPTGVYKQENSMDMFFRIAINNIGVAFKTFVMGILFGLGTVYALFQNGFMLGTFFGLFYQHNQLATSFPIIMIHGTLELSAIVLAGGAGLRLGAGFMFPGTHTRLQSFQAAAKDGAKAMLGLVPIFTIAAFLESYATRHSDMPSILKYLIIVFSLAYVIWYYIIFPILIHRQIQNTHYGKITTI